MSAGLLFLRLLEQQVACHGGHYLICHILAAPQVGADALQAVFGAVGYAPPAKKHGNQGKGPGPGHSFFPGAYHVHSGGALESDYQQGYGIIEVNEPGSFFFFQLQISGSKPVNIPNLHKVMFK